MTIITKIDLEIEVGSCDFKSLTYSFLGSLTSVFSAFASEVLLYYFKKYYENGTLKKRLGVYAIKRKTAQNKTKFKTVFGIIWLPQIQVRVQEKKGAKWKQKSITRFLLGVSSYYQIPNFMKELIGWMGALSTYRVAHSILGELSNFKCSLMSVWNSVQYCAENITLGLSEDGINEFEADGTGIPTKDSGKRGSELKQVFQRKEDGSLHLVGISIGKYKSKEDWKAIIAPALKSGLEKFKKVILACDGDKTIINVAKAVSEKVKIQADIWHVFHQMKYTLWKDGIAKELRSDLIGGIYKIMLVAKTSKEKRSLALQTALEDLLKNGCQSTFSHLSSAIKHFYTYEEENNNNIYTSKTERAMRTTNQRINVGVWSDKGALNVAKIRLAYYYNGVRPSREIKLFFDEKRLFFKNYLFKNFQKYSLV